MSDPAFYRKTTLPDFRTEETPPIPVSIGPYKIESLLDKGGMSLLYLGLHPESRQPIAVKVLSPKYLAHPEYIERFLKEAHIIALSDHPNIIKLYGEGEWEGGLYIAMEFIRGISLRQFIMQQSLSLRRSLDIILQVAYALCHLHTHGIIHRDLKPENILITEEGEIKVIDFGIAQLQGDIQELTMAGTPLYMSPEQKENPSKVSFASDIYALGVIAYELLLGKLSFGTIDLTLLPKGLRKFIGKALAISQKERYQDTVDFITDISQYLKSGEINKDRSGADQLKELFEKIQDASQSLSPATPPQWPHVDIGIGRQKGIASVTSGYVDFFRMQDGTFVILTAESLADEIEGALFGAYLKGAIAALFQGSERFEPLEFLEKLSQVLNERCLFSLALVHLDPEKNLVRSLSCGPCGIVHLAKGENTPRKLAHPFPPIGEKKRAEYMETDDNWEVGDTLLLYPFDGSAELEKLILEAFIEHAALSPGRQAEAILKKASLSPSFSPARPPKALIIAQRMS